jgi:O-antigen/teichoic acid export membrane protein
MATSVTNKVFALSFGKVLTSLIGLASGMILSRVLLVHDYATYRQTLLVYTFLVPVLTLGLPDAVYFFLGDEKTRKRGLVADNLLLLTLIGFIFALFLLLGGNKLIADRFNNPDLVNTLRIFAWYAVFTLPLGTLSAVLVVQNRIKQLLVFNIVSRFLLFSLVIGAAFYFANATGLIYAEIASGLIVFMGILFLLYHALPADDLRPNTGNMKRMLRYSVPLGLSSVLGTISVQLHQIIVSSICTPAEYAMYANGAIEIPVIGMITGSIATVILVEMRQNISDGKTDTALMLFRKAALPSAVILIPVMFFLLIEAKSFIEVLFSTKYTDSVSVFRIYLLILPARIIYYGSALMAFGLTRIILIRSALSLIFNSITAIILVYLIGYIGAIISFLFVLYLWDVAFNMVILSRKFNCKWYNLLPLNQIGKVFLVTIVTSLLITPFMFVKLNNILSLVCSAAIFFPIVFVLLRKYKLLQTEWLLTNLPKSWQKFLQ